ncbi:MFS transporter [Micromonospora sp. WMMA1363]|uniref:MFS transporter n=1 Tax=Micromonospora sp. WMMA1363 TaxID=3053985 RepID=UPI00259CEE20|nr:MFS transporter [Micromonospora sp. WMMA1363]MDM4719658.1 MFS transporter [Micromonospora sp. WMMA1363]
MTDTATPPRAGRREWAGLAVLSLATLMITFDMFVLLLALPHLSADLRPTSVEQLWILDIYGFMVGGFLITMGSLGDRIGRRRLLLIGAAFFAVASLVSAWSSSPEMLIVSRAVLGIAGATLAPSTLALISNMFPNPRQMGTAIGMWAGSFTLGAILGPLAGGLVLQYFWWGSVFLLGVPVMVLLLILAPMLVPEFKAPDGGRLDFASAGLSLAAVLAFIYGLKEVSRNGFEVAPVIVGLLGITLGVMFVRRQRSLADPLMDLTMFRSKSFSTMLVGLLLYGMVGATSMLYITQFFQSVAGMTPLESALALLPGMAAATISAMVSPILGRRFRPAYLIGIGLLGVVATFAWFTQISAASSPVELIIGFAVIGACDGPLLALGTNLVVGAAPPEKAGSAGSLVQTSNEAGAALGVAVLGSVGAVIYRQELTGEIPAEVPATVARAAEENAATAVAVAADLPAEVGSALVAAARQAFSDGLNVFSGVSAVVLVIAALFIMIQLRHVPPMGDEEGSDGNTDGGSAPSAERPAEPVAGSSPS